MAKRRKTGRLRGGKPAGKAASNGVMDLIKELWQAVVNLRGSIEAPDYKLGRLREQFAESDRLQAAIAESLTEFDHGT